MQTQIMQTKLNNKRAVIIILSAAISPLVVCLLLLLFGIDAGTVLLLGAIYLVFGLVTVLVAGWAVSGATKNSPHALSWSVVGYTVPALLINLAIIGTALN